MTTKKTEYTEGSGNIYQDLGFIDAEERLIKARLAMNIDALIDKMKLTQDGAAKILGINQPKISALVNGKLSGFSIERLFKFLIILNQDINIIIKPHKPTKIKQDYIHVHYVY